MVILKDAWWNLLYLNKQVFCSIFLGSYPYEEALIDLFIAEQNEKYA